MSTEANLQYWEEYTNLQFVKHKLLRSYLGAWYPIISRGGFKRAAYIETHAGRGRHKSGKAGSPIVALETLVQHNSYDSMIQNTEFVYRFVEIDTENATLLESEVGPYRKRNPSLDIRVVHSDTELYLDRLIAWAKYKQKKKTKLFVFVDPFGYSLPVDKLALLQEHSDCELLINFMWRFVDMALQDPGKKRNLDALFGKNAWGDIARMENSLDRCTTAVERLARRLHGDHRLWLRMLGENQSTKYVLLHSTNSDRARDVMKDALWRMVPEGDFCVRQSDDPAQEFLLRENPSLKPLEALVWDEFAGKCLRLRNTYGVVDRSVYRRPHYHSLLKEWYANGNCDVASASSLIIRENPEIRFVRKP